MVPTHVVAASSPRVDLARAEDGHEVRALLLANLKVRVGKLLVREPVAPPVRVHNPLGDALPGAREDAYSGSDWRRRARSARSANV